MKDNDTQGDGHVFRTKFYGGGLPEQVEMPLIGTTDLPEHPFRVTALFSSHDRVVFYEHKKYVSVSVPSDADAAELRKSISRYPPGKEMRIFVRKPGKGYSRKNVGRLSRNGIEMPPAHALVTVCSFLLSESAYRRYIEPTICDMRREHYFALKNGNFNQARWIVIRGYWFALKPFLEGVLKTLLALVKSSTA